MSTKKSLLTNILKTLERIEYQLDTIISNTTPGEISQETKDKFGLTDEAEFLTEEDSELLSKAEKALYEDDEG